VLRDGVQWHIDSQDYWYRSSEKVEKVLTQLLQGVGTIGAQSGRDLDTLPR